MISPLPGVTAAKPGSAMRPLPGIVADVVDDQATLVWIGSSSDAEALQKDFQRLRGPGGEWNVRIEAKTAFVSLVGLGLSAREAAKAEGALEKAGVRIAALRSSPHALVFRVPPDRVDDAVRALHAAFLESA